MILICRKEMKRKRTRKLKELDNCEDALRLFVFFFFLVKYQKQFMISEPKKNKTNHKTKQKLQQFPFWIIHGDTLPLITPLCTLSPSSILFLVFYLHHSILCPHPNPITPSRNPPLFRRLFHQTPTHSTNTNSHFTPQWI